MINIDKCEKEFLKFTEKFNLEDEKIKRKQEHSLRVIEKREKIAKTIN